VKKVLLALIALIFCSISLFGATFDSLNKISYAVFKEDLSWRDISDLTLYLSDVSLDTETFDNAVYFKGTLNIKVAKNDFIYEIAFVFDQKEALETAYNRELQTIVRYANQLWFEQKESSSIAYVEPNGFWLRDSNNKLLVKGSLISIVDYQDRVFALANVANYFTEGALYELAPIWAKRSLIRGMEVSKVRLPKTIKVTTPFSLDNFGLNVNFSFRIPNTLSSFTLEAKIGSSYQVVNPYVLLAVGLQKEFALSSLTPKLINYRVEGELGLLAGLSSNNFLYGTKVNLNIIRQSGPSFFWGFSMGYSYLVQLVDKQSFTFLANEKALTISPIVGWLW
jgi:hypothetical protein